jgi:hypothetical protein
VAVLSKNNRDRTVRIIQIAEYSGTADTGGHTGRFLPFTQPLLTKGALIGITVFLVDITGIIWTGSNARLTADTFFTVNLDRTVFLVM